jgi:hypothetical protein
MKIKLLCLVMLMATSCTHLTNQEKNQWRELQNLGVRDNEDPVASPGAAGALNILPGFGNFYLASGNGGDSSHWIYGALNLVTWPFSIIWGVPEAAIDASTINKRELIYHYHFDSSGKEQLKKLQNDNK